MAVYTMYDDIKDKLLKNNQILKCTKRIDNKNIYIFIINDFSLLSKSFTFEEQNKIIVINNKFTF